MDGKSNNENYEYASSFDSGSDELDDNEIYTATNIDEAAFDDTTSFDDKRLNLPDADNFLPQSYSEFDDDSLLSPPEIRLTKLLSENDETDFNNAKVNKIKCLALCKIIYGESHWRVAEAHVQLANAYLKRKHSQQILKHTKIARDILVSIKKDSCCSEESEREFILQNLYLLMGRANYQLSNFKVSENNLLKAKLVSDHTQYATSKYLNMKINILSALGATLSKIGQLGQAIEYIEQAIETVGRMSVSEKHLAIDLYKQIATIDIMNGKHANITFANETASKALELSIDYFGKDSEETAEIYILISRIQILNELPDYEKIEGNLEEALRIYELSENNDKKVHIQEMICKILMKQERFPAAKSLLKKAINEAESTSGDMSLRSAELYELMGNILFAENKMSSALIYFLKAEEIYKGKKRCQNKLPKLLKLIDVIRKSKKDKIKTSETKLKERPRFN